MRANNNPTGFTWRGSKTSTARLDKHLYKHGFAAPSIRPPTVAPGSARVRLSLRADMTEVHIDRLLTAIASCGNSNTNL